mmetsp:Transcript_191/g.292  ORF Transcript_191/g.292 Transcript_191/m.292 type:complete len:228 (+) Transcript_191:90-773(+)
MRAGIALTSNTFWFGLLSHFFVFSVATTSRIPCFIAKSPVFVHSPSRLSSCKDKTLHETSSTKDIQINRRRAIETVASTSFTSAALFASSPEPATASSVGKGSPLFVKVQALESANYIGQIGKPVYVPNTNGAPEKHLPQVSIDSERNLKVTVPHVMTEEHYIQFMWLKDAKTNEVVLAKEFAPSPDQDGNQPTLKARVPPNVTLRPYLFCNLHGLWKGEDFQVSSA